MTYTRPEVRDYGTLVELTADIDANFAGALTRMVMLAAISGPMGGSATLAGGDGGPGDTLVVGAEQTSGDRPGPAGGEPPGDTPRGGTLGTERGSRDAPGLAGGGAGGTATAGGGSGNGAGDSGGRLPFTGHPTLLAAFIGASVTSAGAAIRSKLRRSA